jgi:hypothetical protein
MLRKLDNFRQTLSVGEEDRRADSLIGTITRRRERSAPTMVGKEKHLYFLTWKQSGASPRCRNIQTYQSTAAS